MLKEISPQLIRVESDVKGPRDEIVKKIAELTGRTPRSVHFQTVNRFSVPALWDLHKQALTGKKPGALMNYLIKK